MKVRRREDGFTLVELTVAMTVFAIAAVSFFALYNSLIQSTIVAKRQAVALTLATNQMEYLKSLPYDSLIVIGGSIVGTGTIPETTTQTINGVRYTTKTSIDYVDDAFDGCGAYPSSEIKLRECRGSIATTPMNDANRGDYKLGHVSVTDTTGKRLAEVNTQIAAKVAEAASTKGALFVNVIDDSGNAIPGVSVNVVNTTVAPSVDLAATTDNFGLAIFYDVPPDSGTDYIIKAEKNGYSKLSTINTSGSLQPNYLNQKMLSQQASYTTLVLMPQADNSLVLEAVDTSGNPISNLRIYVKGGYKRYTDTTNTTYCFDTAATTVPCSASMTNPSPLGTSPVTGADGQTALQNLAPGTYIFCGDDGASTVCQTTGSPATRYYLVAAMPYAGNTVLNPVAVPNSGSASAGAYVYDSKTHVQKVRLVFSTNVNFPRISKLNPYEISKSSGTLGSFNFTVTGRGLPCTANGVGCGTTVRFSQNSTNYPAACTGSSGGTELSCTANLTGIDTGYANLFVSTSSGSIALPTAPLGGLHVTP